MVTSKEIYYKPAQKKIHPFLKSFIFPHITPMDNWLMFGKLLLPTKMMV